jgi:hypothetical protein
MKNPPTKEIIYSINVGDIQEVAKEVLDRRLTKSEIDELRYSVGNYIDWFQAIEHAINKHVQE